MIILASTSPRRAKLLEEAKIEFQIVPSAFDESSVNYKDFKPQDYVMHLAKEKAQDVFKNYPNDKVMGADTIVYLDNQVFGKPRNVDEAYGMIKKLSGKTHFVYTGVAIISSEKEDVFYSVSEVVIRNMSDFEIRSYVETKRPLDKAGAYAIQEDDYQVVESYKGDFFTIVGLPLKEVIKKLSE